MGGRRDSSGTRVAPVFSALEARGSAPWLRRLLSLPEPAGALLPGELEVGSDLTCAFGHGSRKERRLAAPPSLLRWLIPRVERPAIARKEHPETASHRRLLFDRDPSKVAEAIRLIDRGIITRGWHVFEGPTAPDVVIETSRVIVVIEGKRTERGPTRDTQWMPGRHQMWRHIDAAWEVRGGRDVYGFFIVQGDQKGGIPELWRRVAEETASDAVLASSLPHRSDEERAALRRSFLGVTTWDRVVSTFGLPPSVLIPSVEPRTRK